MDLATGKFEDRELSEFQMDKDVIEVSEHFLVHEKMPTIILVLHYRDLPNDARRAPQDARKDWRSELDSDGKKIYDELRLWRGRKAKREGMPPYLILNNRELAELAMRRPISITKLREINGIGEAKSARWGEEILSLLSKLAAALSGAQMPPVSPSPLSPPPPEEGGYRLNYGCSRIASFRPLGEDSQRYSLPH